MSLLRFASPSMKRDMIGRVLGLDPLALDSLDRILIKAGSAVPFEQMVGRKLDLNSLIALLTDKKARAPLMDAIPQVGAAIGSPDARRAVAQVMMQYLEQDPDGSVILDLLQKVSTLDIPGFADTEYDSALDFVEVGLLPFISEMAGPDKSRITCAHCTAESDITPNELQVGEFLCPVCTGVSDCSHAR